MDLDSANEQLSNIFSSVNEDRQDEMVELFEDNMKYFKIDSQALNEFK